MTVPLNRIFLILTLLFVTVSVYSQKIEGRVLEKISENQIAPIIGANVYWENSSVGTSTDNNGYYSIDEAPSFPANLLVSFIGYEVSDTEIIDENYIFYMSPNLELDEVDIKERKKSSNISIISTLNTETLSSKELEKAACCNLSECFETNATVDVSYNDAISGAKKIRMLGLDGIYTQITQENLPLIRGLSSSFGLLYTPGPYIESIQIIKGTGSVINGFESFTGQINLEYFKPDASEKIFYNLFGTAQGKVENNLRLIKNNGKWKSNLFLHHAYHDLEVDHNNDNFLDMAHHNHFNLFNRWKYESDKIGAQFYLRAFVEERQGGTIDDAPVNYDVEIENRLIEVSLAKIRNYPSIRSKILEQIMENINGQTGELNESLDYEEDLAEGQRQDLLQREYEAMMRPEPILYSASGGLTQFNEGGDTKPQVISRQKRPYAINTDYMPGINPEVLYFNPATMNPAAMTIMEDGTDANRTIQQQPMSPDFYDNFSKGGFDVDYKSVPTQTSIDPYQKYTGVAPPAFLEKSAIASPEMNLKPLEPMPTQNYFMDNIPDTFNGIPMSALAGITMGMGLKPRGDLKRYIDSGGEIGSGTASQNLFNEGGETAIDPLIKEAKAFIMGETEDDSIVQKFVEKYGTDAYLALREEVLQSLIPNAQTEGLIAGIGNGGMDDDLRGNIGGKETIAVSQDEFIVPADVVSMLGDGSSDAGAKELYDMMDRVRKEKYGTTKQAKPIDNSKVLPA
mgnify:CR=1 FL=1